MRVLRWIGIVVGILVGLVVLAVTGLYAVSSFKLNRSYTIPAETIAIPSDAATVERGRHLATAIGKCVACHGANLGGMVFIEDPALGRFVAVNLTSGRGGMASHMKDTDWVRAIRHGVGPDGKGLRFMPSDDFYYFSGPDLAAVIAYVKSVPPVDSNLPESTVGPLGRFLYLTGQLPLVPAEVLNHAVRPSAPPPGVTVEYGKYLAETGGCIGCHGAGLSGGHVPGTPPSFPDATNLTPTGLGAWTEQDFFRALREGKRPAGTNINPFMPWKLAGQMTDDEIKAVWLYLKSVPPKPTGQR